MGRVPVGVSLRLRGLTSLIVSLKGCESRGKSVALFRGQRPGKLRISSQFLGAGGRESGEWSSGAVIASYPRDGRNTPS